MLALPLLRTMCLKAPAMAETLPRPSIPDNHDPQEKGSVLGAQRYQEEEMVEGSLPHLVSPSSEINPI